tara:strand:- start:228 stop:494 length:267 start_codon:yes stop_codon:yes gene_type:complete
MIEKNSVHKDNTWDNSKRYELLTESLQRILDYITPSEFQHYCEASVEERAEHIYNDLELVQNYIATREEDFAFKQTQPYKDPRQKELF